MYIAIDVSHPVLKGVQSKVLNSVKKWCSMTFRKSSQILTFFDVSELQGINRYIFVFK